MLRTARWSCASGHVRALRAGGRAPRDPVSPRERDVGEAGERQKAKVKAAPLLLLLPFAFLLLTFTSRSG
jgi:hypothetical protein